MFIKTAVLYILTLNKFDLQSEPEQTRHIISTGVFILKKVTWKKNIVAI